MTNLDIYFFVWKVDISSNSHANQDCFTGDEIEDNVGIQTFFDSSWIQHLKTSRLKFFLNVPFLINVDEETFCENC